MRATHLCSICAVVLASHPDAAAGDPRRGPRVEVSGGISLAGNSYRGLDLSGAGPFVALEVGVAAGVGVELDYRRHALSDPLESPSAAAPVRAESRMVSVLVRHTLFSLRGERYLDLHGGLASERFELVGTPPCSRRVVRLGVTLLQPGSMYRLSNHLELRFGIEVLLARAWPAPGPADCTGPCTSATAGRSHDIGFLGTFAIGLR